MKNLIKPLLLYDFIIRLLGPICLNPGANILKMWNNTVTKRFLFSVTDRARRKIQTEAFSGTYLSVSSSPSWAASSREGRAWSAISAVTQSSLLLLLFSSPLENMTSFKFSRRHLNCAIVMGRRKLCTTPKGTQPAELLQRKSQRVCVCVSPQRRLFFQSQWNLKKKTLKLPDDSRRTLSSTISWTTPTANADNSSLFQMSWTAKSPSRPHHTLLTNSWSNLIRRIIFHLMAAVKLLTNGGAFSSFIHYM